MVSSTGITLSHVLIFLCVCISWMDSVFGQTETDPCGADVYTVLDDARRDVNNKAAPLDQICDIDLTHGWYRLKLNGSDAEMPTSCVQPNQCGTQAPIWLDSQLPDVGREVTSRACSSWANKGQATNCCFYPYRVTVRNCGGFYVYKLGSSLACNIAYCAQKSTFTISSTPSSPTSTPTTSTTASTTTSTTTPPPPITTTTSTTSTTTAATTTTFTRSFVESRANPTHEVDSRNIPDVAGKPGSASNMASNLDTSATTNFDHPVIQASRSRNGRVYVRCLWRETESDVVWTWYEDVGRDVDLETIARDTDTLELGFDVDTGHTVVCSVRLPGAGPEVSSEENFSDALFLGISVKEHDLVIKENGSWVNLTLTSSVPIPCSEPSSLHQCRLGINLMAFDIEGTGISRLRFSTCYTELTAFNTPSECNGQFCFEQTIRAVLFPDPRRHLAKTRQEAMVVGAISYFGPDSWKQDAMEAKLYLEDVRFRRCHVMTDPHIVTADSRDYNVYVKGTFLLFRSSENNFQVHIRVSECGASRGFCVCGVVAQNNGDVISVDNCHGRQGQGRVEVTFPLGRPSDDVRVYDGVDNNTITVVFVSGFRLRLYVEDFGLSLTLLSPGIASKFKVVTVTGLCGNYNGDPNDDLPRRDARTSDSPDEFRNTVEFVERFRLPSGTSLFDNPSQGTQLLRHQLHQDIRCDCSPLSTGAVCPKTSLFSDVIASIPKSVDATRARLGDSVFPRTNADNGERPFTSANRERRKRQTDDVTHSDQSESSSHSQPTRSPWYYFEHDHYMSSRIFVPRWKSGSGSEHAVTERDAADACAKILFRAPVTLTCVEYDLVGRLISVAFEFCKQDVQIKNNVSWSTYSIRLIQSACEISAIEGSANFTSINGAKPSWPSDLSTALTCPLGCREGSCEETGCRCEEGFTGISCDVPLQEDITSTEPDLLTDTERLFTEPPTATYIVPEKPPSHHSTDTTTMMPPIPVERTTLFIPSSTYPNVAKDFEVTATSSQLTPTTPTKTPTPTLTPTTPTPTSTQTPTSTPTPIPTPTTSFETSTDPSATTTMVDLSSTLKTSLSLASDSSMITASSSTKTSTKTPTTQEALTFDPVTGILGATRSQEASLTMRPLSGLADENIRDRDLRLRDNARDVSTTPRAMTSSTTSAPGRSSSDSQTVEIYDGIEYEACDVTQDRCTLVTFKTLFKERSLACRIGPIQITRYSFIPLSQPFTTSSVRTQPGQLTCVLPYVTYLYQMFPNAKEFQTVRLEAIDKVTSAVIRVKYLTIFDSTCQVCRRQGRHGCAVKPNTCYIDNKCYQAKVPKPYDPCQQCVPSSNRKAWSANPDNQSPVILAQSAVIVFNGQDARMRINATDPEGSKVILTVDRTDAFISQSGDFLWRAVGIDRGQTSREEKFTLAARDVCNATTAMRLVIRTVPCGCLNRGLCVKPRFIELSDGQAVDYDCQCRPGYTGPRCERETDECQPNPCRHGTCVDLHNNFRCLCQYGFQGSLCDKEKDPCERNPCFPSVACFNQGETFTCGKCPDGFHGDGITCTATTPCAQKPCFPGVTCSIAPNAPQGYECGPCPKYFVGDGHTCQRTAVSACDDGACSELCDCQESNQVPGYTCGACPSGYVGDGVVCTAQCNISCPHRHTCVLPNQCGCIKGYSGLRCNIPVCDPPCLHSGICYKPNECRCYAGYTGSYCQMSRCAHGCRNGGRCIGKDRCLCPYGYSGSQCQVVACRHACMNGGHCVGPNTCSCPSGYTGKHCETPICQPQCLNSGVCLSPGQCHCQSGYQGNQCERALCYPSCKHGGVCRRFNTCKCPYGYNGRRCQYPICRPMCMNGGRCIGPDKCLCTYGWTGHRCDQPLCHLRCVNGGVCINPDVCSCPRGFAGSNCSQRSMVNSPSWRRRRYYYRRYYS